MNLDAEKAKKDSLVPFLSWLTNLTSYPHKPWVIAVAIAAVAAVIAGIVLTFRYTRATGIVLRLIGILFLAYGAILIYVKFRVHAIKVPPNAWEWIPFQ